MNSFFHKLKRINALLSCSYNFISGSILVSIHAFRGTLTREQTTSYMHENSKRMLKNVNATYALKKADNFKLDMNRPRIYMSNHLSLFDTPLFLATVPDTIRIVTKKELLKFPLISRAIIKSEHAIVDRSGAGKNADFYKDAKAKLADGVALWFFPEGTRSRQGVLMPFKPGGFKLACEIQAQIIPVGIIGTNKILPADNILPNLNQVVEIHLGLPIEARDYLGVELQQKLMEKVSNNIKEMITT